MVYIVAVQVAGGSSHEHIVGVKWQNGTQSNTCSRQQMIEWIDQGNTALVTDGYNTVTVGVVKVAVPYLRTFADSKWTDNLLALPRY